MIGYDTPIRDDEVTLSKRTKNILVCAGFRTIGNLCYSSQQELLRCRNLGKTTLDEIEAYLAKEGLSLGMSAEDFGGIPEGIEEEISHMKDIRNDYRHLAYVMEEQVRKMDSLINYLERRYMHK